MRRNYWVLLLLGIFLTASSLSHAQVLREILKRAVKKESTERVANKRAASWQTEPQDNICHNPAPASDVSYTQMDVKAYSDLGWNPYVYNAVSDAAREFLVQDKFNTNKNNWFLHDNYRQYSAIKGGDFVLKSRGDFQVVKSLPVPLTESQHFEIEARIKFVQGNTEAANYLTWGQSPYAAYQLGFTGSGRAFTFDRLKGGRYEPVISWKKTGALKPAGKYNRLTVRKVKDTYFFFINKELVGTAPFDGFFGRHTGFTAPRNNQIQVDEMYVAYLKKLDVRSKIKTIVTEKVEKWQKKGKFEKTQAYKRRMKTAKREHKIQQFTQETINELARKQLDYALMENDYDPDNEVFKLKFGSFNPVYLPVPIDEAPEFDAHLEELEYDSARFTLNNQDQFAILHLNVTNPANGKTYVYDSDQLVAFKSTELDMNFDPVDVDVEEAETNEKVEETEEELVVGKPKVDTDIPQTSRKNSNTYALIIGNQDYSTYQRQLNSEVNVDFAVNDARIFKQYMTKTLGLPRKNITFLTNATLGQMQQAIAKMNAIAEVRDGEAQLIFYYSGHGLPDEATKEPYVIPVDVSGKNLDAAIKLKDIYNSLTEYPAEKVTVFLDACFSGGARSEPLVAMKGIRIKPKDHYLNGNLVVFSSSTGAQSSNVYRAKSHGLFTYYLLKKLQESRGNVTYRELAEYLVDKVELESVVSLEKKQTPQIRYSPKVNEKWEDWSF